MKTIVYCRISSSGQTKGVSLDFQLDECKRALISNKISDFALVQEVNSAYEQIPPLLNTLLCKRSHRIVFYAVDRFSRNVAHGIESAKTLIKNKCVLVFIKDQLIVDTTEGAQWLKFVQLLTHSEAESRSISIRVKSAICYLKRKGYHVSGHVPYGFSTIPDSENPKRKCLSPDEKESDILNFISFCRTKGTSIEQLNRALEKISPNISDPIVLEWTEDNKTEELKCIRYEISYEDIAYFLNAYEVSYRGKNWTSSLVRSVYSRSKKDPVEKLEKDLSSFEFKEKNNDTTQRTLFTSNNSRKTHRTIYCKNKLRKRS